MISVQGTVQPQIDAPLLERDEELAVLAEELAAVTRTRLGRLVLIAGEAGIGKTALVRAFCEQAAPVRVLTGACDALHTPRPLGPLVDIAEQTGGRLAKLVNEGASVSDLLSALTNDLRRRSPSVVVLEDLHWADQATRDLVRVLGRRIESVPALVLATYRDDELDRVHPLRIALGELPPMRRRRLTPARLSLDAVGALAEPQGIAAGELHARTRGNPFYVTEVLASGGASIPDGVRDAVLARAARLGADARLLLEAVAIAPPRAELWLLEQLAPKQLPHLEACIASGMLHGERDRVAFRHEIARVAIEEAMPPDRAVGLHRAALRALSGVPGSRKDLARIVHHAEAAGDGEAVLRHATAAAAHAAAVGAHSQAARLLGAALEYAAELASEERADLLERHSYECYLTNEMDDAVASRRAALAEHARRGNRIREGDCHRWLSRLLWFQGASAEARDEAARAVELLESDSLPPGPELAMAYSTVAQLRMLANDLPGTRQWGARASDLAERLGETATLIHSLNNVGTAEYGAGQPEGAEKLERSLRLAREAGLEEQVARGYTNLASGAIATRNLRRGARYLEAGIEYCAERDLDSWLHYMLGWKAEWLLGQGHWDEACRQAAEAVGRPSLAVAIRIMPLIVLGKLRVRRGDPDPWHPLDEAAELAAATGEVQRLAPVACARAEARWLGGEHDAAHAETERALVMAIERQQAWEVGELCVWRRRAGIEERLPPTPLPEPFRLELVGDHEGAARQWEGMGYPYEAAIARACSENEAALRESLAELQRLGARTAAARVARSLRERGVRDVRRGPRASTRENAAGLTPASSRSSRSSPTACAMGRSPSASSSRERRSIITSPRSSGS